MRRPLVGSLAGHVVLLIGLIWLTSRYILPLNLEPEAVTLVFEPAPIPATQVPAPSAPTPTPEPQPPPPQQPLPETPPPPPEPQPQAEDLPLPPPPVPEPPPPPARRPPPPRPSTTPPRPQPAQATPAPTAPPQAAASAAPAAPASQPVIAPSWQSALGAWLEAHKTYPEAARRRDEQGRAVVRFTVDHSGQVLDVQLVSGTGSTILDDAVKRMLTGARVPPFTPGMDEDQITVTVQLRYKLE